MELFPLQCLLWRCVLVLSALRAVLQAVVQSAVLRSCASRPCALQHSRGSSAAPSNLLFPEVSAAPLHAHLCAGMCAEPYTHVQRLPITPVHSHTRASASLHSCMCVLHPRARKSVIKQKALCKDLDALSRVHAYTHMRAPHPFAHPRARQHERCSGLAHSHVHAHTCKTFTCKHRAHSHVQCTL